MGHVCSELLPSLRKNEGHGRAGGVLRAAKSDVLNAPRPSSSSCYHDMIMLHHNHTYMSICYFWYSGLLSAGVRHRLSLLDRHLVDLSLRVGSLALPVLPDHSEDA
jgi:hypothetical protein